ncbi:helix-turn-helix domain-containing protein [uncultured Tateyamaria sp.]|uniref:helix-turn-helix domain-containing protein n=1 Tax=uncultured Tateyamaria sp. TaxID=455651 RepID=UPI002633AA46|nr:helix-turn-helix domain-containing protein [uncultured Tateyamaria sp.]
MTTPATFRPKQSVGVVGVSSKTLYRWAKAGYIRIYKKGGCSFFKTDEVVAHIETAGG